VTTLIDDMKMRIEQGEANVRKEVQALSDTQINHFAQTKELMFAIDGRITANEVLKNQFEVFVQKQSDFDKQWLGYKDEVKQEFARVKD